MYFLDCVQICLCACLDYSGNESTEKKKEVVTNTSYHIYAISSLWQHYYCPVIFSELKLTFILRLFACFCGSIDRVAMVSETGRQYSRNVVCSEPLSSGNNRCASLVIFVDKITCYLQRASWNCETSVQGC